jgi:hypothetical protein
MTILIVILAWIVLSLFGWSLLRIGAQADRNSHVQPLSPWALDSLVSRDDARDHARGSVVSARRSQARSAHGTRARV